MYIARKKFASVRVIGDRASTLTIYAPSHAVACNNRPFVSRRGGGAPVYGKLSSRRAPSSPWVPRVSGEVSATKRGGSGVVVRTGEPEGRPDVGDEPSLRPRMKRYGTRVSYIVVLGERGYFCLLLDTAYDTCSGVKPTSPVVQQ